MSCSLEMGGREVDILLSIFTVQSDILRVSQCHFRALMEVIKTLHPLSPSLSSRDDRQSMIKLKEHYQ